MSLTINADLTYLKTILNLSDYKMQIYQDKSLEEILQAEAAEGNQAAVQLAADMFTDSSQLIELFQLANPENKLVIMSAMSEEQLKEMIPLLDEKDLLEGLNFFNKESLLNLLKEIPKDQLVSVVFEMFSENQVIEKMPTDEIDKLLKDSDLEKTTIINQLDVVPSMYLQQIIESVTGEEAEGNNRDDFINQLSQFSEADFRTAITNLEPVQKRALTFQLTSRDKKLYEKFDTVAYTKMIERERDKKDIVPAMGAVKEEELQKMIEKLPTDLMSIVLTQIDTAKFADNLITKHPEILAQFVGA